jgi:hypothetical protein
LEEKEETQNIGEERKNIKRKKGETREKEMKMFQKKTKVLAKVKASKDLTNERNGGDNLIRDFTHLT